jgi:hypothetical protein
MTQRAYLLSFRSNEPCDRAFRSSCLCEACYLVGTVDRRLLIVTGRGLAIALQ